MLNDGYICSTEILGLYKKVLLKGTLRLKWSRKGLFKRKQASYKDNSPFCCFDLVVRAGFNGFSLFDKALCA